MNISQPVKIIENCSSGELPGVKATTWYLISVIIVLCFFIAFIGYELHNRQGAVTVTIELPEGVALYLDGKALPCAVAEDERDVLHSCRVPVSTQTIVAVHHDGRRYPLQIEFNRQDTVPQGFIYRDGELAPR